MKILDKPFDGVIFDMDGLILDNGIMYRSAYQNAAQAQGFSISRELYSHLLGLPHAVCDDILQDTFGSEFSVEKFTQAWKQEYHAALERDGVRLRDGFEELFAHLEAHQIPVGLATSSDFQKADLLLGRSRYLKAVNAVSTVDDIQRGKPDPEIYLTTAKKLNLRPGKAIVFEDANNGMRAAIAAGCLGVMVPNQAPPDEDVKQQALLILSSLKEAIPLIIT
ncbi:MAG: HAD family hydrolase [Microcoleaceae cyanobacterium]